MKSCGENQNLMSTLLPLKIVRVPRIAASKISIRKEEYLACFKHDTVNVLKLRTLKNNYFFRCS